MRIQIKETMHNKQPYWLVFHDMDIIGKFETMISAQMFVEQYIERKK